MLAGQTILVTGATGAIGQAICKAVVADGARVVIHYGRNRAAAEALLDEVGGQGWCLPGDLATPEGHGRSGRRRWVWRGGFMALSTTQASGPRWRWTPRLPNGNRHGNASCGSTSCPQST
ncbi:SDR family NAD(P)-dependent oxidoreductase [Gemmobacter lanyuensis]